MIDDFNGVHRFLSNFSPSEFLWVSHRFGSVTVPTVEHPYQAEKATNLEDFLWVLAAKGPGEAKRRGRELEEQHLVRQEWHTVKFPIMRRCLDAKFRQNPDLAALLLATGDELLVEGNHWHDNTWGDCHCNQRVDCDLPGANWLGRMLMDLRGSWFDE